VTRPLTGIFLPVVTTFGNSGELDLNAFAANLEAHRAVGIAGIVVAGSNGEAPLLEEKERTALIGTAREIMPEGEWLIAGTGAESTRLCIKRCREAAEQGADAVMVVSPHYYTPVMTSDALYAHFSAVADSSPLPVILYNIPKYAHFSFASKLVARLSMHGNIIGLKDSSGDLDLLHGYLESQSGGFTVLTGSGSTLLPALEMGARGGVVAVGMFAAALVRDVTDGLARGNRDTAAEAQRRLVPLASEIVGTMGVAGVKAALDLIGLRGGRVRAPLLPLGADQRERVSRLLQEAGQASVA
jgi:4-hydroxy-2-oxoglutarate aldolase